MADLNLSCAMGQGVNGSYDNLLLETKCVSDGIGWRHPPCDVKLKSQYLYVPQGTPLALHPSVTKVDDTMFMLARNWAHPDCCPSTYSTSTGCVCTTPEQIKYIASRGTNHSYGNI